jgi:hypothetical protein
MGSIGIKIDSAEPLVRPNPFYQLMTVLGDLAEVKFVLPRLWALQSM